MVYGLINRMSINFFVLFFFLRVFCAMADKIHCGFITTSLWVVCMKKKKIIIKTTKDKYNTMQKKNTHTQPHRHIQKNEKR